MYPEQQERALRFLDDLPWDDVDGYIRAFEDALRVALEATREDFLRWEQHADEAGYSDEFSLTQEQVDELSDEWRLAWVARLLRNMALMYGVGAEFRGAPLAGETEPWSVGGIVRTLNDISWIR
jgi:hypothetical protein